jgi:hypothetical protein
MLGSQWYAFAQTSWLHRTVYHSVKRTLHVFIKVCRVLRISVFALPCRCNPYMVGLFYCLSLLSYAFAQNHASHSVTIALPPLLSVRLNDMQLSQSSFLIADTVQASLATTQQLGIRTNGIWTLSANFTSCGQNDSRASVRAGQLGEERSLRTYPRVILTGAPTQGWEAVALEGSLEASVNSCQGKLVYTLTQP